MKKTLLLFTAIACIALAGCSKNDSNSSPYAEDIIGTWTFTHIYLNDSWIDITTPLYSKFQASATFYTDGSYYGTGYFGTGWGTYTLKNDTLVCYIDGSEYIRYEILSLSDGVAEMILTMGSSSLRIRCAKE